MNISTQINDFLEITGMPKTVFCKRVGFSPSTLDRLLSDGDMDVSNKIVAMAQSFMCQTTKKLIEASK